MFLFTPERHGRPPSDLRSVWKMQFWYFDEKCFLTFNPDTNPPASFFSHDPYSTENINFLWAHDLKWFPWFKMCSDDFVWVHASLMIQDEFQWSQIVNLTLCMNKISEIIQYTDVWKVRGTLILWNRWIISTSFITLRLHITRKFHRPIGHSYNGRFHLFY